MQFAARLQDRLEQFLHYLFRPLFKIEFRFFSDFLCHTLSKWLDDRDGLVAGESALAFAKAVAAHQIWVRRGGRWRLLRPGVTECQD